MLLGIFKKNTSDLNSGKERGGILMHWLDIHFNEDKTRAWDMNVQTALNIPYFLPIDK